MLEIADRKILADRQLEVAAAQRDHQATVEARRPDDVAVDQALDVAQDRIAAVGARGEILVELFAQHDGERTFDTFVAQLLQRRGDGIGIVGVAGTQRAPPGPACASQMPVIWAAS